MLCSLPPAMPSQFESLKWRPSKWAWPRRQVEGSLSVTLKTEYFLLLFPALIFFFFLCVRVCVRVPAGLKSQHQTLTSQSLGAAERRRCQDVQHQKVSLMSLLIYSRPFMRKNIQIYVSPNDNGWHFWSATLHRWLAAWKIHCCDKRWWLISGRRQSLWIW